MGTRYTTIAISGYNASPPADDGTEIESNKVKWSTIKTKLDDPIKTRQDAIDAALVAFADLGPIQKSTAYTTTIADHLKTIEVTGTTTITLGAVGSMGAGYTVTIRNVGVATVTVDGSALETIDGDANFTLAPEQAVTVQVNAAASGYITASSTRAGITDTAGSSQVAITTATTTVSNALNVSGALTVTGALTANGNTTIGNASGDTLTFHPSTWTLNNDTVLSGANVGIGGAVGANHRFDVKGATADATQWALRARDSADSELFSVRNDGYVKVKASFDVGSSTADTRAVCQSSTVYQLGAKNSSGNAFYYGASTDSTPDGIISNNAGTEVARFTNSGNFGLGVTPEAWSTSFTAVQIGGNASLSGYTNQQAGNVLNLYQNVYDDGATKYISTDEASHYYQLNGSHIFRIAPSGTADTAITWHTALTIANSGAHTIAAPSSAAVALSITGYANQDTVSITADSTSGQSKGVLIKGGTTSADYSARFQNQAGTATYLDVDGAGNVVVSNAALATTATDGFLYIPSSAGTPTGVPTAKTGRVPIEYDTTNDALMVNNSTWKDFPYHADVSGYDKTTVFNQFIDVSHVGSFSATGSVTVSTWESIGPTGSGATNIWAAMDEIPTNAKWIEFKIVMSTGGSTTAQAYGTEVYVRETGRSPTFNDSLKVGQTGFTNRSGLNENDPKVFNGVKVTIDSSQRFDLQWRETGTSVTSSIVIFLVGWGA